MAQQYGLTTASRFQQTVVQVQSTAWTKLEGSTPLANRTGTELFNKGQAATIKMYLTYTYDGATPAVKQASSKAVEIGSYHFEPNGSGMTLWGRMQAANGRVIVTEYGA